MTALAVDASVVLKWVFPHRDDEAHVGQALAVLEHIRQGRVSVLQPPHWLAEVAAVVARLEPRRADEVINLLHAMEFPVPDGVEVLPASVRAGGCAEAARLRHPLSRRRAFATGWRALDRGRAVLSPRPQGWSGNPAQRLPVAYEAQSRKTFASPSSRLDISA